MKNKITDKAKRLLFPARCPGCDGLLSAALEPGIFCDSCKKEVIPIMGKVCFHCGKPIDTRFSDLCRDCEARGSGRVLQGRGAFVYTGPMKTAMYRFKYSGRRSYAGPLAKAAVSLFGPWFSSLRADAIIPVPMYKDKQRDRGYNQAEVFARELSKLISVPVFSDVLIRTRNTRPQKGLDRENRRKNLKKAFKIKESSVKFECVIIVDDIYTTGTTINEVSSVLKEAFGCRVFSFCVCIGVD
jgi:ComF family protein